MHNTLAQDYEHRAPVQLSTWVQILALYCEDKRCLLSQVPGIWWLIAAEELLI